MTHKCPHPDCVLQVPTHRFGCRRHWLSLPPELRIRIWSAYEKWKQAFKSSATEAVAAGKTLRAAQAAAVDFWDTRKDRP